MILRAAAVCSVDPGPFRFGELLRMLELRLMADWDRTSSIMALIANAHAPKGQQFEPDDFNPYAQLHEAEKQYHDIKDLGAALGFERSKE